MAIMWIVLLQARHFAQGKTTVLAEFTAMQTALAAKITHIMHSELPVTLIAQPAKHALETQGEGQPKHKQPRVDKAQETTRETDIHPLIKKEFAHVHHVAPNATIKQMCNLCNVQPHQLVENNWVCLLNLFEKCMKKKCFREHRVATDQEAKNIVQKLEQARKNPERLKEQ
eukprot:12565762-Ditylum_brightwellii.AAC.1